MRNLAAMRMSTWLLLALLLLAAAVMGATVMRAPIAQAAQLVDAKIIAPLDGDGSVKVHEQGTPNVHVTNVRSAPVPVDVTDASVPVEVTDASIRTQQAGLPVTVKLVGEGDTFTVPAGKQLLVQYVNGTAGVISEIAIWKAGTVDFSQTPSHRFFFVATAGVMSEPVTIHASGAQIVRKRTEGTLELSGYLIDT